MWNDEFWSVDILRKNAILLLVQQLSKSDLRNVAGTRIVGILWRTFDIGLVVQFRHWPILNIAVIDAQQMDLASCIANEKF